MSCRRHLSRERALPEPCLDAYRTECHWYVPCQWYPMHLAWGYTECILVQTRLANHSQLPFCPHAIAAGTLPVVWRGYGGRWQPPLQLHCRCRRSVLLGAPWWLSYGSCGCSAPPRTCHRHTIMFPRSQGHFIIICAGIKAALTPTHIPPIQ